MARTPIPELDVELLVAIAKANGHPSPVEWCDLVQAHYENPEGIPADAPAEPETPAE